MASERLTLERIDGRIITANWLHDARCSICETSELCLLVRKMINEEGANPGAILLFCKDCLIFIESGRQLDPGEANDKTLSLVESSE